jgi:hypothetical protein
MLQSSFASLGGLNLIEQQQQQMAVEVGLTSFAPGFAFFCTRVQADGGKKQWLLVQVDMHTGNEVARVPVRAMPSRTLPDLRSGLLYVVYDAGPLDALPLAVNRE